MESPQPSQQFAEVVAQQPSLPPAPAVPEPAATGPPEDPMAQLPEQAMHELTRKDTTELEAYCMDPEII